MTSAVEIRALEDFDTDDMIEALWQRGMLGIAASEFRKRTAPKWPWWHFRLSDRIWGLSGKWLAVCPWNGDTAWITLPFFYFGIGTKNIEWRIGGTTYGVTFDIRWRWE